jgi:hypothetical protein
MAAGARNDDAGDEGGHPRLELIAGAYHGIDSISLTPVGWAAMVVR